MVQPIRALVSCLCREECYSPVSFILYQFVSVFFFLCQLVLDKDYEPMETGSAREKGLSP